MSNDGDQSFDLVIQNAFVFDGVKKLPGTINVGVNGNVISRLSSEPLQGREIIDASGCWLTPGLIDSHVHLYDFYNCTDPAKMTYYLDEQLPGNLRSFLKHGITTIKSVGDPVPELLATRARLAAGELVGPLLLMTGSGISAPKGHPSETVYGRNPWYRERVGGEVDTVDRARATVSEMAELGMDAIKLLFQGGCACHGEPDYKFHGQVPIVRLKLDVLAAAIDEAHRHGLKATVHTHEQDRAIEALEAGADGLEHGVVADLISDDRLIELLLRNDASWVPTLWVYPTPEAYRNLATVHEAGVRIALGTDSFPPTAIIEGFAFDSGTFGANSIVETERMAEAGLSAVEILKSATSGAATHLGRDDLGVIGPGKRADLLLFRADPTENVSNLKDPLLVVAAGHVAVNATY
ncbi:amidohydrolase family protein [Sphingomonas sp.]|uniref:amidohydrolase family protein n=1 Tax=Sphingomonas sp. TaxID=28214 RepID=UPI002FCC1641